MKVAYFLFGCLVLTLNAAEIASSSDRQVSPELLKEISDDRYIDKAVQTTNGEPVGILADVILDWSSGQAQFALIQVFENIDNSKEITVIPWQLLRYDPANRRLEAQASLERLRSAPQLKPDDARRLAQSVDASNIHKHFGLEAAGGGSVAASMGTQTGVGASGPQITTNEAHPLRGSVAMIYIAGALAIGLIAGRYLFARREAPIRRAGRV